MATGRVPTTANSPLTAKGDLFGYSTTQARVAVGNDGETLVADSSTSTGLRYQANFAAGKNKIINGDMGIWQRGTSFSNPASSTYTADRVLQTFDGTGATRTISQQTFTPGTAPVAGYEGQFFYRYAFTAVGTSNTFCTFYINRIEDVRTFAGQTVTFSFWAKNDTSKSFTAAYAQNFGSGGSGSVSSSSSITIGTTWARYSVTFNIPSVSGKTIGSSSFIEFYLFDNAGTRAAFTIDLWGVQVEAGSVATAFQTATGTIQGELAACQRYFYRAGGANLYEFFPAQIIGLSTSQVSCVVSQPVTMRAIPTVVGFSNLQIVNYSTIVSAVTAITIDRAGLQATNLNVTGTGTPFTVDVPYRIVTANSLNGFISLSAEL
jgi:hypothetical protein